MTTTLILAATAFLITGMICLAGLRAWHGWLALKRLELDRDPSDYDAPESDVGLRIELAAVRERLKQLEEIASGVEL